MEIDIFIEGSAWLERRQLELDEEFDRLLDLRDSASDQQAHQAFATQVHAIFQLRYSGRCGFLWKETTECLHSLRLLLAEDAIELLFFSKENSQTSFARSPIGCITTTRVCPFDVDRYLLGLSWIEKALTTPRRRRIAGSEGMLNDLRDFGVLVRSLRSKGERFYVEVGRIEVDDELEKLPDARTEEPSDSDGA